MSDSDEGTWGGAETEPGAEPVASDWSGGQPDASDPTSGGDDSDVSGGIESAWCFTDTHDVTHTIYAKSQADAQAKARGLDYCHQGACQYSSAIEEARLCE